MEKREITITLQKIKNHHPCRSGWEKVLKSKGGTKADFGAEFPLSDVLESNNLDDTLWCLQCLPEHNRIWRKYAVWCARQVEHLMTDSRSKKALDVAELYASGLATDQELSAAENAARSAARSAAWSAAESAAESAAYSAAWSAAESAAENAARSAARSAAESAAYSAAWSAAESAAESAAYSAAWNAARSAQEAKLILVLKFGEWK